MKRLIFTLLFSGSYTVRAAQALVTNNSHEYSEQEQAAAKRMFVTLDPMFSPMSSQKRLRLIENFLKKYPTIVNIQDTKGRTPLMYAAGEGYWEIAKLLIAAGAKLNEKNIDDMTALMFAARYGRTSVVKLLVGAGASLDEKDNKGWTALMHLANSAFGDGYADTIKILIESGADINARDNDDWTPLMRAADWGYTQVVKPLIEAHAKLNEKNRLGRTALMYAALGRDAEIIKLLIAVGADQTIKDNWNETAADLARNQGFEKEYQAVLKKDKAERVRYKKAQTVARQEVEEHIRIPDLAHIVTDYAYHPQIPHDLPKNENESKCTVQ